MNVLILFLFIVGYALIVTENALRLNKAATALVSGMLCWLLLMLQEEHQATQALVTTTSEIASIVFFLIGAMTIVEVLDTHNAFDVIADRISTNSKVRLLWFISVIAFLLSALLDNLTTTILLVSIIRKILQKEEDRWLFSGMIVIAANAGGVWSPMGDVTTTMLWISERITSWSLIKNLFLPALISFLVPLGFLSFQIKNQLLSTTVKRIANKNNAQSIFLLVSGIALLVSVPVVKALTHLPPFMIMLLALGILWLITEMVHFRKPITEKKQWSVSGALQKIDIPSMLFFTGILYGVAALEQAGWLHLFLKQLENWHSTTTYTAILMGVFSAIIDNVPLVAAGIKMFDLSAIPQDHFFWHLLAFTTGTGGSMLIIGSAAGVAAMGMEKITFTYYLRKFSWLASLGFIAGVVVLLITQ
jgi:Na+/H+ antiporter NhaD/arsenite permease-like protein